MDQDRTWHLFALKLTGKATSEEWAELQQIMEEEPKIALHLQALTNFWHQHSKYDKERIEKAIKKIAENHAQETPGPFPKKEEVSGPAPMGKNKSGFWPVMKKKLKHFIQLFVNSIPT